MTEKVLASGLKPRCIDPIQAARPGRYAGIVSHATHQAEDCNDKYQKATINKERTDGPDSD